MDIATSVVACIAPHPAIRSIRPVGSRVEGHATEFSDWDFRVLAEEFPAAAEALPSLVAPLDPLVTQWDRLSTEQCCMLILRGPAKVDLIFSDEPHALEPPWSPSRENLAAIDAHFWDWMLWLRSKEARGDADRVADELAKLFDHLLAPLRATARPQSIEEAVSTYRGARSRAERAFRVVVPRGLESEVAPVVFGRVTGGR
jgi:hypothetical protein